jgi:hypothetical protein
MSTNEQDREIAGAVSTINSYESTTVIVNDPWEPHIERMRLTSGVHRPEVGPPSLSIGLTSRGDITVAAHLMSAEAIREHIRGMQHALDLFEPAWRRWERKATERGSAAVESRVGTPEGHEFADALDADREGRAA